MRTRLMCTVAALFIGAIVVSGCDSAGSGNPTMEESMAATVTALGDQVHALEHLETDHGVAIAAAADLAAIKAEEADEAMNAMMIHHEMESLLGHMAMCMHDDAPPNTDSMAVGMDDLAKEIDAHTMAMNGAADMAAAMTEEDRHQAAMAGFVTDMNGEHDAMAKTADSYMCPMENM